MEQKDDGQDDYNRNAEFHSEELQLEAVVNSIDATIERREARGPVYAGDAKAADIVKELLDTDLTQIQSVRGRPYFGRIDYLEGAEGDIQSIYIGDVHVDHEDPRYRIVSRNAPIASLYYRPADGFYEIPADAKRGRPLQRREVSVHLKRMLTIGNAELLDIDDVLRLAPGSSGPRAISSRILDERLSGASGDQLPDAIQTIQPEQYKQIASTTKPVLIVQGAAGSGKSLIGLHRIDFILSPFSNIGSLGRPTAERVIMFGPSPAFLEYVSGLLPGLGINRVRQTTVRQWLLNRFSSRVTLSSRDKIYDDLMNNRRKLTEAEIEAHSFKAGLKMKRLVDNYVGRISPNPPKEGVGSAS